MSSALSPFSISDSIFSFVISPHKNDTKFSDPESGICILEIYVMKFEVKYSTFLWQENEDTSNFQRGKKDINCVGWICFILSTLFVQRFCFPLCPIDTRNCWFAYLIFWEGMQIIYIFKKGLCPDYFSLKWFQLSYLCLSVPFTIY